MATPWKARISSSASGPSKRRPGLFELRCLSARGQVLDPLGRHPCAVGGQGRGDLDNIAGAGAEFVALCDVDHNRAGDIFQKRPQAKRFTDFRRMFDEMEKEIDAVLVATPDHTHAVITMAALKAYSMQVLAKSWRCERFAWWTAPSISVANIHLARRSQGAPSAKIADCRLPRIGLRRTKPLQFPQVTSSSV